MSRARLLVCAVAAALCLPGVAAAQTTLDFEGVGSNTSAVPGGYGGFSWYNLFLYGVPPNGLYGCSVTGSGCVYNGSGVGAAVSRATPFNFLSAHFTSWYSYGPVYGANVPFDLTLSGWLGATQVYTTTITVPSAQSLVTFDWNGIDQLTFVATGGQYNSWYLMDDFTYGTQTAVPEPVTLLLVGTGLASLGAAAARRHKRNDRSG